MISRTLLHKILIAFSIAILYTSLSVWLAERIFEETQARQIAKSLITVILVVTGIVLLRVYKDKGTPKSIGVGSLKQAVLYFGLGASLIVAPISITLLFTKIFGWSTIMFNAELLSEKVLLYGMLSVLLFEAIPEELLFRGYLYSNLNTRFQRWKSALMTIGLFVISPFFFVFIQDHIFGLGERQVGHATGITPSYILTLFFFGLFNQYLRILTKSVWAGVGFHLVFVYMNWIIGADANHLIQLDINDRTETPMQITMLAVYLLTFILLLIYPRIRGRKIGWNELQT